MRNSNATYNGKKIKDALDVAELFQTYDEALHYAMEEFGWEESNILDRETEIGIKYEDNSFETIPVNYLMIDPGANIEITFLEY